MWSTKTWKYIRIGYFIFIMIFNTWIFVARSRLEKFKKLENQAEACSAAASHVYRVYGNVKMADSLLNISDSLLDKAKKLLK